MHHNLYIVTKISNYERLIETSILAHYIKVWLYHNDKDRKKN